MVSLSADTVLPRNMRLAFKSAYPKKRWAKMKKHFTLSEISGSLGDLGTLLPLVITMSLSRQIDFSSTLIFGGLWNIVTGLQFGTPMCVQPQKAIAAVAIATSMSSQEIAGAGLFMGGIMVFLGATRTVELVSKWTPRSIIKGIQLGTGLSLVNAAQALLVKPNPVTKVTVAWSGPKWHWADNFELGLAAFIFAFTLYRVRRVPVALILFLVGFVLALIRVFTGDVPGAVPGLGFRFPSIVVPTGQQFWDGTLRAGLGQLPLTLLNSVIAVTALVEDLFPDQPAGVTQLSISVGIMNLVGPWFGAMPFCHGAGGLAGQYRFGARSEVSIIFLGTVKIILGFVFGSTILSLLDSLPKSLLAVMLFISGVELSTSFRGIEKCDEETTTDCSSSTAWLDQKARRFGRRIGSLFKSNRTSSSLEDPTTARDFPSSEHSSSSSSVASERGGEVSSSVSPSPRIANDSVLVGIVTAGAMTAFSNAGIGFLAGVLVHVLLLIGRRFKASDDFA